METCITEKKIRIKDVSICEMLNTIVDKSSDVSTFNTAVNLALNIGVPLLYSSLIEGRDVLKEYRDKIAEQEAEIAYLNENVAIGSNGDATVPDSIALLQEIIKLLKDLNLSSYISKKMLSSLFNAKKQELSESLVEPSDFINGILSETPEFLIPVEEKI